ncbi:hypothetical protein C8Q74DRAFT_1301632 [Fomes fomentarius]|nr:hypothetical protein C8Q74DRAFT_1301632 [Fomes fomentarius]
MSAGDSPSTQTNLPPPSYSGVFAMQVTTEIDAPLDKVWDILADFTKYPEWNPFVRSQVITDKDKKPLAGANSPEDQTPAKGKYLLMHVHIPPTMDDSARTTEAFEQIVFFDDAVHRLAWKSLLPQWFVRAERWQALSTTAEGRTRYESREVFAGVGAYLIKWVISKNLQKSFDAMGDALKARAERQ